MKTLYLIFSKLKTMICKDLFFFAVLCVGVLTCNIMFTYMYGIIMQVNERDGYADFYLYYAEGEKLSINEINDKLSAYKVTFDFYAALDEDSCSPNEGINFSESSIRARQDMSFFKISTGNIKNIDQPDTVIIPKEIDGLNIGDKITLNGKELTIVGTVSGDEFLMSASAFDESGFKPDAVGIDAASRNVNKLKTKLSALFGTGYMIENTDIDGLDDNDIATITMIVVIYLLCVLAFLYLMVSIYDDSAYELNVYEILGATRKRILTVFGGVMLIILAVISLISQIIHAALYDVFFSKLNYISNYEYTVRDYAVLFFITLFSVYLFVFVYILIRARRSTIVNARKFIT